MNKLRDEVTLTRLLPVIMAGKEGDAVELAEYRKFDHKFLSKKNIFYTESVEEFYKYNELRSTHLVSVFNRAFKGTYNIPIMTTNGLVYTFYCYDPGSVDAKYSVPKTPYKGIDQGRMLGNLQSLGDKIKHEYETVFILEGFFDAFRVESESNKASIALLGSSLTSIKSALLLHLKNYYKCKFVYIKDNDKAGENINLIRSPLWDRVIDFNEYIIKSPDRQVKDIDDLYKFNGKIDFNLL